MNSAKPPNTAGVYSLGSKRTPMYIGTASNLAARLRMHEKLTHVGRLGGVYMRWLEVDDSVRFHLESFCIHTLKPALNKSTGEWRHRDPVLLTHLMRKLRAAEPVCFLTKRSAKALGYEQVVSYRKIKETA